MAEIARLIDAATPFANGAAFGLGDIAVGAMLGYLDLRFAQLDWRTPYPHLVALYDRLMQRRSFRDTQPAVQTISDRVA